MKRIHVILLTSLVVTGCVSDAPTERVVVDYEEVSSQSILDAPSPVPGSFAPADRGMVERGEYLVELLGCGICHTDGALEGGADMDKRLAGSRTGIAYTSPLQVDRPGVVYPPNITPDTDTGIGSWTDQQIENAITAGLGTHVRRRIISMPWQGYSRLSEDDARAIVLYLRSIKPIRHNVPADVEPGKRATAPFVYFGVYRSN